MDAGVQISIKYSSAQFLKTRISVRHLEKDEVETHIPLRERNWWMPRSFFFSKMSVAPEGVL